MKINFPLMALAMGAFGIGVTEFSPMGMLPVIAGDLGVSIPTAGMLISAYAFGVLIGAPVMTLLCANMPRRRLLVLSMGIFTVGNAISAMADSYSALMVGRIITSLNHGMFFGIGAVVATNIVPPNKRAGAVAAMFSGLTIATIGGVPLASFIGTAFGWRSAFWGIAAIGVMVMVALRVSLPPLVNQEKANIRNELTVLGKGPVLAALLLTVVGASSMFTVFTYIVPILQQETHESTAFVTAMLVLYGAGLAVGNILGGRYADRSLYGTLIASLIAAILLLVIFALVMSSPVMVVPLIFLWGVASFAVVPPLQSLVVHEASEAPNLASAMNIGAFNLGNAIGAALGGGVISMGLGLPAVALAGAGTTALGLFMVLVLKRGPSNQGNEQVTSS
ncbi:Inner membrane transport protein YdhP [Marinomonas spartinae]|uniref:Inner membrane transport protein YdhP n=1 Tax=Marinomonas spartinae TaxID=1792290 RepID=A0A1A8T567_9GAMM|nr:MFS transporter [Marinomonas spartinae]SBS26088.1 Inner membrane transport protein YdhP [Marinomonas spartinae]SBS39958.1 Inner membrane transport protein YdhP [Marinomonas spartinae]